MKLKALNAALLCMSASAMTLPALAAEPMEPSGVAQVVMSSDPKDFFETAASANMFEIEASKLAAKRSQDAQVKAFAEMMIKDHTQASEKLKVLAAQKKVTLPTQLLKRHQMMLDGLKDEKDAKEFDEEYRSRMVMSHKEAVSLFDLSARESPDADIRKFAGTMLPTLQMHGSKAQEMEKAASDRK